MYSAEATVSWSFFNSYNQCTYVVTLAERFAFKISEVYAEKWKIIIIHFY